MGVTPYNFKRIAKGSGRYHEIRGNVKNSANACDIPPTAAKGRQHVTLGAGGDGRMDLWNTRRSKRVGMAETRGERLQPPLGGQLLDFAS